MESYEERKLVCFSRRPIEDGWISLPFITLDDKGEYHNGFDDLPFTNFSLAKHKGFVKEGENERVYSERLIREGMQDELYTEVDGDIKINENQAVFMSPEAKVYVTNSRDPIGDLEKLFIAEFK